MIWTRNVAERALATFVQAAFASVSVVAVTDGITGKNVSALETIGVTALGAGIAAVLSLLKNLTAEGIAVNAKPVSTGTTVGGNVKVIVDPPTEQFGTAVIKPTTPGKKV